MQQVNPDSKLADAQHALAREYGFKSWPSLKTHVESQLSPFAAVWTANLLKSKQHPLNKFKAATLQFAVTDDTVTISHHEVSASGHAENSNSTLVADGKERPAGHGEGYIFVARWLDRRLLEAVEKKDGRLVGRGTYEVSPNGQTLTITTDEQVIVLDRT